jgi:hypothetical protein
VLHRSRGDGGQDGGGSAPRRAASAGDGRVHRDDAVTGARTNGNKAAPSRCWGTTNQASMGVNNGWPSTRRDDEKPPRPVRYLIAEEGAGDFEHRVQIVTDLLRSARPGGLQVLQDLCHVGGAVDPCPLQLLQHPADGRCGGGLGGSPIAARGRGRGCPTAGVRRSGRVAGGAGPRARGDGCTQQRHRDNQQVAGHPSGATGCGAKGMHGHGAAADQQLEAAGNPATRCSMNVFTSAFPR